MGRLSDAIPQKYFYFFFACFINAKTTFRINTGKKLKKKKTNLQRYTVFVLICVNIPDGGGKWENLKKNKYNKYGWFFEL